MKLVKKTIIFIVVLLVGFLVISSVSAIEIVNETRNLGDSDNDKLSIEIVNETRNLGDSDNDKLSDYYTHKVTNYVRLNSTLDVIPVETNDNNPLKLDIKVSQIKDNKHPKFTNLSGKAYLTLYTQNSTSYREFMRHEPFNVNSDGTLSIITKDSYPCGHYFLRVEYGASPKTPYYFSNSEVIEIDIKPHITVYVSNYNFYYKPNNKYTIKVFKTNNQKPLSKTKLQLQFFNSVGKCVGTKQVLTDSNGIYKGTINYNVGSYSMKVRLVNNTKGLFGENSSSILVLPQPIKLTADKISGYAGLNIALHAKITGADGKQLRSNKVKFTINGKNYYGKIGEYGDAYVVVKLPKAKTYSYTASYSNNGNYQSALSSAKVVVKKAPSKFTIKIGKYSCKISHSEYNKIIRGCIKYYDNEYDTDKTSICKVYKNKKVTLTKKKLYIYTWKSGNTYKSRSYESALDTPSGYKWVGNEYESTSTYSKHYIVYKKTINKKVVIGKEKCKIKIWVYSTDGGILANLLYRTSKCDGEYKYDFGSDNYITF